MEDYKKKLKLAKERYNSTTSREEKEFIEALFPELKESEDERVRKAIVEALSRQGYSENILENWGVSYEEAIAWLEKQSEEKPANKVDPKKFKVGDWVIVQGKTLYQIKQVTELPNNHYQYWTTDGHWFGDGTEAYLWTIQDAKKGNILQADKYTLIFDSLTKDIDGNTVISSWYYCDTKNFYYGMGPSQPNLLIIEDVVPATEEQCDLLFQKMKEAGYEWDAEKKELKKIEQSCYHNDGLYYAIDILEKTLGKVEGYQSDDGILEHQKAIETVNALYHKKPAEWSEEDELMLTATIQTLEQTNGAAQMKIDWLNSIKSRVQLQLKQEWANEDEANMDAVWKACGQVYGTKYQIILGDWIKSLITIKRKEKDEGLISELKNYITNTPEEQRKKDWKEIQDWYDEKFSQKKEEESLSEFEKTVSEFIQKITHNDNVLPVEDIRGYSKSLLEIAEKEGKYQALNNIPKWKKVKNGTGFTTPYIDRMINLIIPDKEGTGYYIPMKDLIEKLPKED